MIPYENIHFSVTTKPNIERLYALLNQDPHYPHIHAIDMPYRLASTWQDHGCGIGLWESGDDLLAWAVFQPPWWNVDYAVAAPYRGTALDWL